MSERDRGESKEDILAERAAEELVMRAMAGDPDAIREVVLAVRREQDARRTPSQRRYRDRAFRALSGETEK